MTQPSVVTVGVWELLTGDNLLALSDDACRVLGVDHSAVGRSPETLFALVHRDDVARLRSAFADTVDNGTALDVQFRLGRAEGVMRKLQLRAEHVAAGDGRAARLWGTVHDVTDRARISGVLRATESARADAEDARAQAARILEHGSDAFVALDREWRYTHVNRTAASVFGRTPDELIGKHIWTEFPEGIGQPFYQAYHRAMANEQFEFLEEYYPPYDRWFENRIHPTPDGIAIFFHDITDRKRAELTGREWQQRFSQLADNITEVFWLSSAETGELIFVSPAFETIWGRPCTELYRAPELWTDCIRSPL